MLFPRIFISVAMQEIVELTERIARSTAPVLIYGETGVGKEVVAELIHEKSQRTNRSMICVNCATLPSELIESELFGSVRGSYTGSHHTKDGLFLAADGGTLFLDELSEMPLELQNRLLRVLQEKAVRRVGAINLTPVDVRVIASVHKAPKDCIMHGTLRPDLFYRLSTISIFVPPLRDRKDEIMPLAQAYLDHFCAVVERPIMKISEEASLFLIEYPWPGNVRELQNEMNRIALLCKNDPVTADNISIEISCYSKALSEDHLSVMERQEKAFIVASLNLWQGNIKRTADYLGIGRQTLYNKLNYYKLRHSGPEQTVPAPDQPPDARAA